MALLFEWDPKKAQSNLVKHKISFEGASSIFLMRILLPLMIRNTQ